MYVGLREELKLAASDSNTVITGTVRLYLSSSLGILQFTRALPQINILDIFLYTSGPT